MRAANLVLQDTVERIFVREVYADISRGIFIVRGENVLLLGEIVLAPILIRVSMVIIQVRLTMRVLGFGQGRLHSRTFRRGSR